MGAERKLISKLLPFEVFRRDPATRKTGPVLATVKGWNAFDAFLKTQGSALVRSSTNGFDFISMPRGWDSMVVGMVNYYNDGTTEPPDSACECGRIHGGGDNNYCPKCGACHFVYGEHIPDDMYPLSKCKKCGEGHLWD